MTDFGKLLRILPAALLVVLLCATAAMSQDAGDSQQGDSRQQVGGPITNDDANRPSTESDVTENSFQSPFSGQVPFGLPDEFKGHLISSFSVGELRDNGILNGAFPTGPAPAVYATNASASFAYDLKRAHSDYLIDYRAGASYYNRFSLLDKVTQDVGVSQSVQLGPRSRWTLNERYTMTPDLAGSLMGETLNQEMSFINPVPVVGIRGISTLAAPFSPVLSPADGLITLRSMQMTNSTSAGFTHEFSAQTSLSFQGGFQTQRFEDKNLFGNNGYSFSAGITRSLTRGTSIGIVYRGGIFDLSQATDRSVFQSVGLQLRKQLGRRSVFSISGGPALIQSQGSVAIPLPQLLANLLGISSLSRNASQAMHSWTGSSSLATNLHGVGFNVSYLRGVTGTDGLGGAALSQSGAVSIGRGFGRRTSISVSLSVSNSRFLGIQNGIQIYQEGLSVSLTRQISRAVDLSSFFMYAKSTGGMQGPTILDHNQVGVNIVYHFHRLSASPT